MNKLILCYTAVASVMGAVVVCTDNDATTKCGAAPAICGYSVPSVMLETGRTVLYYKRHCSASGAATAVTTFATDVPGYTWQATKPTATSIANYKKADAKSLVVGATSSLLAILYLV